MRFENGLTIPIMRRDEDATMLKAAEYAWDHQRQTGGEVFRQRQRSQYRLSLICRRRINPVIAVRVQ